MDPELDEVVLFDVPPESADKLWARLAPSHLTWILGTEEGYFVASALRTEVDDLAQLLRCAEAWLGESDLPYLRFLLDGREYVLRAQGETAADRTAPSGLETPY